MKYDEDAIRAAAELSAKYINDRFLPDKAIDVVDETGAADRLRGSKDRTHRVTSHDVEAVVAKMAKIPQKSVSALRPRGARQPRAGAEERHLRAGPGHPRAGLGHQAVPQRAAHAREAHRQLPLQRAHRRGEDRAGQAARQGAGRGVPPLRHERVLGEAHRVPAHRRAAGLRGLRPGRAAHRRGPQAPLLGGGAGRDREGPPGPVQHPAPGDGPRHAHRQQRAEGGLPERGAHPHHQRRRAGDEQQDHRLRRRGRRLIDTTKAKEAIERTFTPEFRNRLDGWILFSGLGPETILKVVDKEVGLLQAQLVGQEGHARADRRGARLAGRERLRPAVRRPARWRGWWTSR